MPSVEAPASGREVDALGVVVAALQREVDAGVHGVGREVQQQRRVLRSGGRCSPARRQPAASTARRTSRSAVSAATHRRGEDRRPARSRKIRDAPPCDLLAQRDAVAVADLRLSLQVLRLPDAPAAPAHARRGRGAARPRRAPPRQGAAGPDRRRARRTIPACARGWPRSASRTSSPTSCGAASARWSAACCRTPTSARCRARTSARLREVTASQGLMLESVRDDLVAHQGSPTKDPALRLQTIRWRRRAADPVHVAGSWSASARPREDRVDALAALAEVHAEHGHLQEVILQNFVPHRRYYGEEPAEIADRGGRALLAHRARRAAGRSGAAGVGVAGVASRTWCELIGGGARAAARRRHPGAAEPRRLVARAGRRGRDRPRRSERQRRPHLARAPVPVAAPGAQAAGRATASR